MIGLAFSRSTILGAFLLGIGCGVCLWKPILWIENTAMVNTRIELNIRRPVIFERKPKGLASLNCRENSTLRLAFTVMSSPDANGARRRSLVRGSWMPKTAYKHPPAASITVKFVLGTKDLPKEQLHKLTAEHGRFGDFLLLPNLHDTYDQLAEKVRQAIQWADKNLQFDYLIKTDDDVLIRLDKMTDALRSMGCPERLFWGHFMTNIKMQQSGKWKETKYHACSVYLPYVSGAGYVLGRQVVQIVNKYSEHLTRFTCEDVSMGFWLAPYNITRRHDKRFHLRATCSDSAIQAHQGSRLQRASVAVLRTGKIC